MFRDLPVLYCDQIQDLSDNHKHEMSLSFFMENQSASPFFSIFTNNLRFLNVRWQSGKGANLILFGGAYKACVAGGQTG